ncbi:MAG: TlpA disulfide reductase family protein [Candidatus Manganitrophaceae bacterium]
MKPIRFTAPSVIVAFLVFIGFLATAVAEEAPSFSLPGSTGPIQLTTYRGKVIYIDFWTSWCIPCRKSFPWMNTLEERYGKEGLIIIAINVDKKREAADAFLADHPARFTVAFDPGGMVAESYRVWTMPSSYLIDRTGRLHSVHRGFFDTEMARIESEIKQLLNGK